MSARATGLAVLFALTCASYAFAEAIQLHSVLSGAAEVPPTSSQGSGRGQFIFETTTNQLMYTIVYDNLSGPTTAAHIHGPAEPGTNASVLITFLIPSSPIRGTATLNESQASALLAGGLYVNIHTEANKGGEIRGQIAR